MSPHSSEQPPPRRMPLIWQVAPIGAFLLIGVLAACSIYVLSGVRAYVGGESHWSKSHHMAVSQLQAHVVTGDPAHLRGFEAALSVQIGDQLAREALDSRPVRWAEARQHLQAGGNHRGDVTSMTLLYHLFSDTWLFRPSVDAWRRGDQLIGQLRSLAQRSQRLSSEQRAGADGRALAEAIHHVDRRLQAEERRFLAHLTRAAQVSEALLQAMVLCAVMMTAAIYLVSSRRQYARRAAQSVRLHREQQRWAMAVASAGLGRFDLDVESLSYHLDAHAARLMGWGDDAITLNCHQILTHAHPEDRERAREQVNQSIAQGEFLRVQCRIDTPDGTARNIEITGRADPDHPHGNHILGIVRDATVERQQIQMTIQRDTAQRIAAAQRSFLSRLSHELRTPLNAILGFAQLLDMDRPGPPLSPAQHQHVSWILQSGRHLLDLVDEVLDLSRIESGQVALNPQMIDVSPLLRGCLPLVDGLRDRLHLTLHDELPHHALTAWADPQRLQQVFLNLLSNACKYNRLDGCVQVRTREDGEHLLIEVADSGLGLSSEDIAQLFQPFHRVGRHTSDIEGTGLGLYIARQLMTRMGGDITVQGQPGEGACFTIRLRRQAPA